MANKQLEKLRSKYMLQLGKNQSITCNNFVLSPIPMEYIYIYQAVKSSICVVADNPYGHLPYMTMLYHLDGEQAGERLSALLALLAMSLRILDPVSMECDMFAVLDGGHVKLYANGQEITEAMFRNMRLIIALQNNIDIPDETENPSFKTDLLVSQALQKEDLDSDIDYLIDWFCVTQRIRREQLFADFTIREFFMQTQALETDILFHIYNTPGWEFKDKKNPYPHWAYRRPNDNPYGIELISNFAPTAETNTRNLDEIPQTAIRELNSLGKIK